MEGDSNPAKLFMSGETVIVSADGGESVFQGISQDLLQQALQEVTQPGDIQQVKKEPGVYARMDGMLQAHHVSTMANIVPAPTAAKVEQNVASKVKLETTDQCSLVIEGEGSHPVTLTSQEAEALGLSNNARTFSSQPSFSGQNVQPQFHVRNEQVKQAPAMVLIPTLQPDGTVAYTVQPTDFPSSLSLQQGDAKSMTNTITSANPLTNSLLQSSPTRSLPTSKVSLLRPPVKPKVILPKTFQQTQQQIITPSQPQVVPLHKLTANGPTTPARHVQGQLPTSTLQRMLPVSTPTSAIYKHGGQTSSTQVINKVPSNVGSPTKPTFLSPSTSRAPSLLLKHNVGQGPAKGLFTNIETRPSTTNTVSDPTAGNIRRLQLITGADGHSRPIEVICSGSEANVRSEQPITQLELQHIQSILQHQQQEGGEGGNQVYRVMYPKQVRKIQEQVQSLTTQQKAGETRGFGSSDETEKMVEEEVGFEGPANGADQSFSVAAFVREIAKSRGRGKFRSRGRPKKGTPKVVNEKKMLSELRRELGLREERVKEFGFFDSVEEIPEGVKTEDDFPARKKSAARTRSGRLSRPPQRIIKDSPDLNPNIPPVPEEQGTSTSNPSISVAGANAATTGAVTNMNLTPPPQVENTIPLPNRRNFIPPAKYICKVCGKLYLGDKKIARHLKHFPSHGFATPEPPVSSASGKKTSSIESWIAESDAATVLEQVSCKLFQSFSLWDLLVKKTSGKGFGTVEALMSLFADMQALVMELKNLVEQCLATERSNEESFCVTISPVMSSVLGLSQSGGATRYVLPYNQIPEHYHKLLGFPTGLRGSNMVTSSTHPNLMSPESTNSIIHPDEENSQMSLSSDTLDQPLGDKVVLEDNLGARPLQDMDEETQDSAITAPSPGVPIKRQRLDSECQSMCSPPPQTPDFLSQGDDSNMSSISTSVTEAHQQLTNERAKQGQKKTTTSIINSSEESSIQLPRGSCVTVTPSGNVFTDSVRAKLPSFSSIISGSPKDVQVEDQALCPVEHMQEGRMEREESVGTHSQSSGNHAAHIHSSHVSQNMTCNQMRENSSTVFNTNRVHIPPHEINQNNSVVTCSNFGPSTEPYISSSSSSHSPSRTLPNPLLQVQSNPHSPIKCLPASAFCGSVAQSDSVGGSAPVSPRIQYRAPTDTPPVPFNRRCSLDNTSRTLSDECAANLILGLSAKLQESTQPAREQGSYGLGIPEIHSQHQQPYNKTPDITLSHPPHHMNSFDLVNHANSNRSSIPMKLDLSQGQTVTSFESYPAVSRPVFVTSQYQNNEQPVWDSTFTQAAPRKGSESPGYHIMSQSTDKHKQHLQDTVIQTNTHSSAFQGQKISVGETSDFSSQFQKISNQTGDAYRAPSCNSSVANEGFEQPHPFEKRAVKSSILKLANKSTSQDLRSFDHAGTSTHVTFSEELSHPIPSVSPAKDFRDLDTAMKRQNPTPPSESQSSSIFSDLECVLNEATDFSFHSALAGSERLTVKTPEKLLASIPPAAIMDNKKSAISFENFVDFEKRDEKPPSSPPASSEVSTEEPGLSPSMMDPQSTYPFNDSPSSGSQE